MLLEQADFSRLVDGARANNGRSFAELVCFFEPDVRRMLEARLRGSALGRVVDAGDIWQAVLLRFYQHIERGGLELPDPTHLLHLLQEMARNELRDQARYVHRQRRDLDRQSSGGERALGALADAHPSPEQLAEEHDLVCNALSCLHRHERDLALGWAEGKGWEELAREQGGTPEAARKCFDRAMARLSRPGPGRMRACPGGAAMQRPTALGLFLCDQVILDQYTGRRSLVGMFEALNCRDVPFTPPPFTAYAALTDGQGQIRLELRVTDIDEEVELAVERLTVELPGPLDTAHVRFRFHRLPFPDAGHYLVELFVEDEPICHRHLVIHQLEA